MPRISTTQPAPADDARGALRPELSDSLRPIRDERFGYHQARHLLWRAGFGGTPRQIETLAGWGPERAVDYLLEYETIPYERPTADTFDPDIIRPYTERERELARRARQRQDEETLADLRRMRQDAQRRDRTQMREIQTWWLTRMIESPRPLEEKLTLFWHGHFATSYRTIENSYHMYMQNQLFRKHAAGSYAELMRAIIRDPAMLAYLDNNDSRKGRPNENLARELMELFSLGVGNYAERDIKEGARALTGYTFEDDRFVFRAENHDTGAKTILGRRGNLDGDGFVAAILQQPACAEFIAAKLYDFFALHLPGTGNADEPAVRGVLRSLAATLRGADYEVRPMLRRLFLSEHFYSPRVMNERIKSPAELVVGAVRSLNVPVRDLALLVQGMDRMGQHIFMPPSVAGWEGGRSWINTATLFVRQNLMNYMLTGKLPVGYEGVSRDDLYDPTPLLEPLAEADPAAARRPAPVIDYLLRLTVGRPSDRAAAALHDFADEHGGTIRPDLVTGMLVLIGSMPEYQLC